MPGPIDKDDSGTPPPPTTTTVPLSPSRRIDIHEDNPSPRVDGQPSPSLTNGRGWDGKLRVQRTAVLVNPEAISDPEYSDDENVVPGGEIAADEGVFAPPSWS